MNRNYKKILSVLLAIVMVWGTCHSALAASDSDNTTVNVTVKFGQTEARSMLDMINAFRSTPGIWYWNEDNTTKTTCTNLKNLVYDYDLEKIAMQRAVEVALSHSHTRPNGRPWYSACTGIYVNADGAENICAGDSSATAAFNGWCEGNEKYSGQEHRRAMLDPDYCAVGIGHVYYNNTHYWTQVFSAKAGSNIATSANDSEATQQVEVSTSRLSFASLSSTTEMTVNMYNPTALPTVSASIKLTEGYPSNKFCKVIADCTWSVQDPSIAKISDDMLIGIGTGTTTLTASALGKTLSIPITVLYNGPCSHIWNDGELTAPATCTKAGILTYTCTICDTTRTEEIASPNTLILTKKTYSYNGKVQKPKVKLIDSAGKTIGSEHYKIQYSTGCKKVGSYTVTVTLNSSYYSGSLKADYVINPQGTSISKLTPTKKGFTAKWKKQTKEITGYQLQYSTNKNFKNAKTEKIKSFKKVTGSVSKLKAGKTYYIRIRTYKTVKVSGKNKTFYSGWSKAKVTKTK